MSVVGRNVRDGLRDRAVARKKHILLTTAWFPSEKNTNGIFVKEQAEALCRAGHKVTVLIVTNSLFRPWIRQVMTGEFERYDKSELLRIIHKHIVFPFPARLARNPAAAVKAYNINRVYGTVKAYCDIHGRPDLVHHHCLSDNAYLAKAIAERLQIPYVFTEHSNYFSYEELNRFNWFEALEDHYDFVRGAAARIAVTEIRARGYERIFSAPFVCVPNLVVDIFASPLVRRSPILPFTFICVAILDPRKRQDILLRAFARAFKERNARVILVGNGVCEKAYKDLAQQLGIERQVTFEGKCDRSEVRRLFDQSHVGVLSSDQETFGIALTEAMFRGLPVIATRSGGPEEIVTPDTGVLVPTNNEIALSQAMKEVFDDYNRFSPAKVSQLAKTKYSEAVIVGKLEQVYDRIDASRRQLTAGDAVAANSMDSAG